MGSTFTSNPRVVQGSNFSIQVVYTGTPNGSIKLQVSNDELNWEDLPSTTAAITTAGATLFNVSNAHYGFVRVIYTRTSSTGSLDATYLGK